LQSYPGRQPLFRTARSRSVELTKPVRLAVADHDIKLTAQSSASFLNHAEGAE
jgi:hypothetical protein